MNRYKLILAAALLLGGCNYECVEVERQHGGISDGICYSLPKTVLAVTVVYSVERRTTVDFNRETVALGSVAQILAAPTIVPHLVPDHANAFVIKTSPIARNLFLDTNQQYTLDDQGILTSVDTEMSDQTVAAVKDFASAAVEFAKAAAREVEMTPAEKLQAQLQNQLDELYQQIVEMGEKSRSPNAPAGGKGGDPSDTVKGKGGEPAGVAPDNVKGKGESVSFGAKDGRDPLVSQAFAIRQLIRVIQEDHVQKYDVYSLPYCVLLDPKDFERTKDGALQYTVEPPQLFEGIKKEDMPKVVVKLLEVPPVPPASSEWKFDGIVYRPARTIATEVLDGATGRVLCTGFISYPQFSPLAIARVESKSLAGSATAMTFSPSGGGLRNLNIKRGSTVQGAGAMAHGVADAVEEGDASGGDQGAKGGGRTPVAKGKGGAPKAPSGSGADTSGGAPKTGPGPGGTGARPTTQKSSGN